MCCNDACELSWYAGTGDVSRLEPGRIPLCCPVSPSFVGTIDICCEKMMWCTGGGPILEPCPTPSFNIETNDEYDCSSRDNAIADVVRDVGPDIGTNTDA